MARNVVCFDPLHATRSALPGWTNGPIAKRPDLAAGPDLQIAGLFCGACGRIYLDNLAALGTTEKTRKVSAYDKIVTKMTSALGMTAAEVADLFPDLDKLKNNG